MMNKKIVLENFTPPDWDSVFKDISSIDEGKRNEFVEKECSKWLKTLIKSLGSKYQLYESKEFILMTTEDEKKAKNILNYAELSRKRILETLDGIAQDEGYGKHVILKFDDIDTYYAYFDKVISSDGEFGYTSGLYFKHGYGHFVFFEDNFDFLEPIVVHELTHALLAHLPIPLWLDEGIAVCSENKHCGGGFFINNEILKEHKEYWNKDSIQAFWSGESFRFTDDGQRLSYHLAEWIVASLSKDYETFKYFVNNADWQDAGENTFLNEYGYSLSEVIESFVGLVGAVPIKLSNQ